MPVGSPLMIWGNNHLCRGFTCPEVLLQDYLQACHLPVLNPRGNEQCHTLGLFIMPERDFW